MSIEAMKQALEAFEYIMLERNLDSATTIARNARYGLRQAIATEESSATQKQKREWVGLTDEERNQLWRDVVKWGDPSHDDVDLMKALEAKLKEKNT